MIRTILYSLIIVLFFAAVLAGGLFGPEQGRKVAQRILEFVHWKPVKKEGVLEETQDVIKQFNDSHRNIQLIRQMTLDRNKKSFEELEVVYRQAKEQLKQLLSDMPQMTPEARAELFEKFTALHQRRAALVEEIIRTQQVLININEQMDQELRSISQWFQEKTAEKLANPSEQDVARLQQYENLKTHVKAFSEESSQLDSFRVLFMRKSKDTVDRLAATNVELENRFRELVSQVQNATPANGPQLWDDYQKLETEQREMVSALNANEEFISDNQAKMLSSVNVLSQSIEYNSETRLQRFRDSFQRMENERRELLIAMNQRQQSFADSQTTIRQLIDNNQYKMEFMREQARAMADQYEQMEEYRKSATAMVATMTQEIKDQTQMASRQTDDVLERSRVHMDDFMRKMDTAQVGMKSFIHEIQSTSLSDRPAAQKLISLNEKINALKASVKQSELQMRSVVSQLRRNQESLSRASKDTRDDYAEKLLGIKERTDDQKRVFSERVKDQMRNLKDQQAAQSQNQ